MIIKTVLALLGGSFLYFGSKKKVLIIEEIEKGPPQDRGEVDPDDAREQLLVLEKLLETNDISSLHWLYVNDCYWKPPTAGFGIMS